MTILSARTLPENIRTPAYDRDAVRVGIVHFGVGNFHRAHQAVYVDDLLAQGTTEWGIAGVSLRSSTMRDALKMQDFLYTLAILGAETEYRVIGALKTILVAPEDPQGVIDLIANPITQLVSSTITEKGYYISSGQVNFDQAALKTEFGSLENPTTIYGFLARGIILRAEISPTSKFTVLCCDNISGGGAYLKDGVEHLLRAHNRDALAWSKQHVSFVSSMVDRVSPATDETLKQAVFQHTNLKDASPVSAEPFTQWIIEDNFAGARLDLDRVGGVFVNDIEPFERMKLRYLNAAHTIASTLGYLYGDTYVHESLGRPELLGFMRSALYENALPNAVVPDGYSGAAYIENVIKRFQNSQLPYANLQVGTDSSQKIQQRWFPTIDQALKSGEGCSYLTFCLGAWVVFIQTALEGGVLNDPKKASLAAIDTDDLSQLTSGYLEIADVDQFAFSGDVAFLASVEGYAERIRELGIKKALLEFTSSQGC